MPAPQVPDRIRETSTTTGTGTFALSGAVTGYRAFSQGLSNGDTCYYVIEAVDANGIPTGQWESGIGTYNTGPTLTRAATVHASSTGGVVNFAAGTKIVFIDILWPSHHAKLERVAAQAIANGTDVKIMFDTQVFDIGGIADPTTNRRFDILRAGNYLVTASWHTGNVMPSGTQANIKVYVNNAVVEIGGQQWSATPGSNLVPNYTTVLPLNAGDYVEMYVKQTGVANPGLNTPTSVGQQPIMSIAELR